MPSTVTTALTVPAVASTTIESLESTAEGIYIVFKLQGVQEKFSDTFMNFDGWSIVINIIFSKNYSFKLSIFVTQV